MAISSSPRVLGLLSLPAALPPLDHVTLVSNRINAGLCKLMETSAARSSVDQVRGLTQDVRDLTHGVWNVVAKNFQGLERLADGTIQVCLA